MHQKVKLRDDQKHLLQKSSIGDDNSFSGNKCIFSLFYIEMEISFKQKMTRTWLSWFFQLLTDWLFWNVFVRLRVYLCLRTFLLTKISNNKYMFFTGLWSMYVFYFWLREGTNSPLLFFSFHAQKIFILLVRLTL